MRFDVGLMGRHQIDQALVALAFTAWISHAYIIVRTDGDVNEGRRSRPQGNGTNTCSVPLEKSLGLLAQRENTWSPDAPKPGKIY